LVPEELNGYRKPEVNFIGWFPSPKTPVLHQGFMKYNMDIISGNTGGFSKIPHDCSEKFSFCIKASSLKCNNLNMYKLIAFPFEILK
jgi:hypothetical protein